MRPLTILCAVSSCLAILPTGSGLHAESCTAKDFASAVDQSGASLRAMTLEAQPKLQERMRRFQAAKQLSDTDYENTALDSIQDAKLEALDQKSSELLLTVDSLGRVPDGTTPDCAKLAQVKAAAAELNTVVKLKSDYMLRRLDEKIAESTGSTTPSPPAEAPKETPPAPKVAAKPVQPPPAKRSASVASATKPSPAKRATEDWTASTKHNDAYDGTAVALQQPDPASVLPPPEQNGYSIDEIRDATRGFFGTISTNLASVIEHAFSKLGRPTAYVLGTEGGGAFLAGLRFGQGQLYLRAHPGTQKVFWHGPSLGTDFGASGSRTLFLIYGMDQSDALYRNFTGIDGSAYFVGGVGLTILKGGPVIMAPIRSGVGVRLGANLGYVRFTSQPTWNPF